jgi:hypothetical protein
MTHIEEELNRIGERLASGPDPFEHAGLYAAQQALCWAAQPEAYASPFVAVTGKGAGSGCCSGQSHPPQSSDTGGE